MSGELLIRDAEATLRATMAAPEESRLVRAAIAWLVGSNEEPRDGLTERPYRDYELIATVAFREATGTPVDVDALDEGLRWLENVPLDRGDIPSPLTMDLVALVAISLASRRRPWLQPWNARVIAHAPAHAARTWLAGAPELVAGGSGEPLAEVRVAFAAKGIGATDAGAETAVLQRLVRGALPDDPLHAAVLLAALAWLRRGTPVALPGRATVDDVVALLRAIPRALQEWTWESVGRTKGATPRKWRVENEYHVQNLLWTVLAPLFPDLRREEYGEQVGLLQPRTDLGIPSLRLIVEAKFIRADTQLKTALKQIAEDASLYFAGESRYDQMVSFIWDDAARSEQHHVLIRGLEQLERVTAAVVVSRPGKMTPGPPGGGDE